jgi:hypothetical protein
MIQKNHKYLDKDISFEDAKEFLNVLVTEDIENFGHSIRQLSQAMSIDHSTFLRKLKEPDLEFIKTVYDYFGIKSSVILRLESKGFSTLPTVGKLFKTDKRIPKYTNLVKNAESLAYFERVITEFKNKRRFHTFIKQEPTIFSGKGRIAAQKIIDKFENFRCFVIGMHFNKFYRLIAEFIVIPSGRKYYPIKTLFSGDSNAWSDEFYHRIEVVIKWIAELVHKDFNVQKITKFMEELGKRKIDVKDVEFKSKDWYCVIAIKEFGKRKGWSEEDFLNRLSYFYKRRQKKITPEMVLIDLAEKQFDKFDFTNMNKNKKRAPHEGIKRQDWYEEWRQGIPKETI